MLLLLTQSAAGTVPTAKPATVHVGAASNYARLMVVVLDSSDNDSDEFAAARVGVVAGKSKICEEKAEEARACQRKRAVICVRAFGKAVRIDPWNQSKWNGTKVFGLVTKVVAGHGVKVLTQSGIQMTKFIRYREWQKTRSPQPMVLNKPKAELMGGRFNETGLSTGNTKRGSHASNNAHSEDWAAKVPLQGHQEDSHCFMQELCL